MADIHAHAFNALTATLRELGIFVKLSDREALAAAVEAAIEPEIRAGEQERIAREILAFNTSCLQHPDPLKGLAAECWHCAFSSGLHKAARTAYGQRYPAPLPGAREDEEP